MFYPYVTEAKQTQGEAIRRWQTTCFTDIIELEEDDEDDEPAAAGTAAATAKKSTTAAAATAGTAAATAKKGTAAGTTAVVTTTGAKQTGTAAAAAAGTAAAKTTSTKQTGTAAAAKPFSYILKTGDKRYFFTLDDRIAKIKAVLADPSATLTTEWVNQFNNELVKFPAEQTNHSVRYAYIVNLNDAFKQFLIVLFFQKKNTYWETPPSDDDSKLFHLTKEYLQDALKRDTFLKTFSFGTSLKTPENFINKTALRYAQFVKQLLNP